MKKTTLFLLLVSLLPLTPTYAQVDSLDINNINAGILTHGDMWWNADTLHGHAKCEFPKGAGTHISTGAALWMGGYDHTGQLHIAAQTYRQRGNDYWPGPLDGSDSVRASASAQWDRVWKVTHTQIDSFRAAASHTVANIPKPILEWPAKGNPYARGAGGASLNITTDMAPFVDADHDGMYDPTKGDYPRMKGDQMIWWVFSDNGHTHNETDGRPLKVEIHATAYAYNRPGILKDIQYYEYNITNKGQDYNHFRIGLWADMDLGWPYDDFIGFDSTHRLGYIYNGSTIDGSGGPGTFGTHIPIAGISVMHMPGDGAMLAPIGSFMYYNNDYSAYGNPNVDSQYYNYLNAKWRDGSHLKNDFAGKGISSTGHGTGPNTNYVFSGNPADTTQWSECTSGNLPFDKRFIIATNDYLFAASETVNFTFALVIDSLGGGCPNESITNILNNTDSARKYYNDSSSLLTVTQLQPGKDALHIYPNPAHTILNMTVTNAQNTSEKVVIYDMLGRARNVAYTRKQNTIELNVADLPAGVYTLSYQNEAIYQTALFVKE